MSSRKGIGTHSINARYMAEYFSPNLYKPLNDLVHRPSLWWLQMIEQLGTLCYHFNPLASDFLIGNESAPSPARTLNIMVVQCLGLNAILRLSPFLWTMAMEAIRAGSAIASWAATLPLPSAGLVLELGSYNFFLLVYIPPWGSTADFFRTLILPIIDR